MQSSREKELQQLQAQGLARKRSSCFDGSGHGERSAHHEGCVSQSVVHQQSGTKNLEESKGCGDDGLGLGFLLSLSTSSSDASDLPSNEVGQNGSVTSPSSSITTSSIAWHEVHIQNKEMKVFQQQFRDVIFGADGLDDEEVVSGVQSPPTQESWSEKKASLFELPRMQKNPSLKECHSPMSDAPSDEMTTFVDPPDAEMIASLAGPSLAGPSESCNNCGSITDSLSSFEYASHEHNYFYRILKKAKRWHRRRKSKYQSMAALRTECTSPDPEKKIFTAKNQRSLTKDAKASTKKMKSKDKISSAKTDPPEFFVPEKKSSVYHAKVTTYCSRYGYQFLASITMFLLLAGAITLVTVLSKSGADTAPPSPFQSKRQALRKMVELISGIESLNDSTNPQYKAFEWMSTVDPTMLDSSPLAVAKTAERYIISLLYFATEGESWTEQYDFLAPGPVCRWNGGGSEKVYRHGVVCDANGNVLRIQLSENNLVGSLPWELERLAYLEFLHLPRNNITATISSHLDFQNLQHLDLKSNQINGTLPTEMGLLQDLRYLNLGSNFLGGSIPTEIGSLSHIEFLSLGFNMLEGSIPSQLGYLELSKTIDLSFNKLEGRIPAEVGRLEALQVLRLQRNALTGNLDADFCSRSFVSFTSDCLDTESSNISCSCCDTCCDEEVCCGTMGCRSIR